MERWFKPIKELLPDDAKLTIVAYGQSIDKAESFKTIQGKRIKNAKSKYD